MSKTTYVTETSHGVARGTVPSTTDFTKAAHSPTALDVQLRAAGKGDGRRPATSEQQLGQHWCATFGHKFRHGCCINGCGE